MPGSKCPQCKNLTVFKGDCSRCGYTTDNRPWVEIISIGEERSGRLMVDIVVAHKTFPKPLRMFVDTRKADDMGIKALIVEECSKLLATYFEVNIDSNLQDVN
ncbi:hypothetical protein [Vibrio sp. 10N.261.46.A3]|uniref:hypothetical protein n=1 Tax=Vibrio sp. 10N.261.46.A3 TaxID=3229658 RepID=UPI00354E2D7D